MTYIGFYGPQAAKTLCIGRIAEGLRQCRDLDGIPQGSARSVGFDIADVVRTNAGRGMSHRYQLGLPVYTWCRKASPCRTVVVDRGSTDDGENRIARSKSIFKPPKQHKAATLAYNCAVGPLVKRATVSVRREYFAFLEEISAGAWKLKGHAAGQGHVALVRKQGLAGHMHGHERRGARCLDYYRRTMKIKLVGDSRREVILVIAYDSVETRKGFKIIRLRKQVLKEVVPDAAPCPDADRSFEPVRVMSCLFKRLPGTFQEKTLLRVDELGLFRAVAKSVCIESRRIFEYRTPPDVIRGLGYVPRKTRANKLFDRELAETILPGGQVGPELLYA